MWRTLAVQVDWRFGGIGRRPLRNALCTRFGTKTAAMLHLVAATPNYSLANDCTYYGLEDDVIKHPFEIVHGHMLVPQGPGLGIDIDVEKVRKYQVLNTSSP